MVPDLHRDLLVRQVDRGDESALKGWHVDLTSRVLPTTSTTVAATTSSEANRTSIGAADVTAIDVDQNDDWSFLDGQPVISIYDDTDTYIVPLDESNQSQWRYAIVSDDRVPDSASTSGNLACVVALGVIALLSSPSTCWSAA